jgi:hypothetical protein
VSQRLGHANAAITLTTYAHAVARYAGGPSEVDQLEAYEARETGEVVKALSDAKRAAAGDNVLAIASRS